MLERTANWCSWSDLLKHCTLHKQSVRYVVVSSLVVIHAMISENVLLCSVYLKYMISRIHTESFSANVLSWKLEELSSLGAVTAPNVLVKFEELEAAYRCTVHVGS